MCSRITLLVLLFSVSVSGQESWTLQRCIDHAFQHNLTLKQGELNVDLADVNRKNAIGNLLPNLNASATHGYNWGQTIDPFTNQFATERIRSNSFGASTGLNLFSGFRLQNAVKQSAIEREASLSDLEAIKNDLALNISSAFLVALLNQELLVIADRNVKSTERQVDRIGKFVAAGQLPQGSLSEILAQKATDDASVVNAQNTLDLSMLSLRQLLQLTEEESSGFTLTKPDVSEAENIKLLNDADAAIQSALNNFPQIKSAEARLENATVGEKIAQGSAYPSLTASYSYGSGYSGASVVPVGDPQLGEPYAIGYIENPLQPVYTIPFTYDYETKPFGDQFTDNINQSLFFSLQIPIFNGFSTNASIQRAKIARENSFINLELQKQQLTQEIERAFADAKAAESNFKAATVAVDASKKAYEYSESRFENGVINTVEYSDARMRLDNAESNLMRNKYEFIFRAKILDFYRGKAITLR